MGYGAYTGGDVDLTHMTLDQVDDLQTSMLNNPTNKLNSSAVGRYQIIRTTLRELRNRYGLSGSAHYEENMQDMLAIRRLQDRGGVTPANLANEWASLPDPDTGRSHYGQRTGATLAEVQAAIDKSSGGGNSDKSSGDLQITIDH